MDSFFPSCCFEPAILEEGVSDHRHERMTMQALPGSAIEVIETEFFFQLAGEPAHKSIARAVTRLVNRSHRVVGSQRELHLHSQAQRDLRLL